jgi:GAF domain-containing protein
LHRYAKRLQALHQIDREILAAQSPETIATAALKHILELVSCTHANIVEVDPQAEAITVLATCEQAGCRDKPKAPVPESILQNKDLRKGQFRLVQNILALPRIHLSVMPYSTGLLYR